MVHLFRFCVSVLMTYNLRHHTESTSLVFPPIGFGVQAGIQFLYDITVAFDIFSPVIMFTETKKILVEQIGDLAGGYPVPGFPEKKSLCSPVPPIQNLSLFKLMLLHIAHRRNRLNKLCSLEF